jgi:hypothetical protein
VERADAAANASGGIGVSAAPGVAFNYHYAFRIPNAKIAAVQEEHAAACEKLGLAHCRITGMRYRLVNNDEISAMLTFKLDPMLARQFGKDGISAVTKSEGMVVDTEISGTDAGEVIENASLEAANLREQLADIETKLKRAGLPGNDRVYLEQQAQQLRQQINGATSTRHEAQKSLATTPVEFVYGSGDLIPGFDGRSPLRDAAATAQNSFVTMISFVLIALGILVPWLLLGGVGYWIFIRIRRRFPRRVMPVVPSVSGSPE